MGDGDAELALALELSAAEARTRANTPLLLERSGANEGKPRSRASLKAPNATHFSSREGVVASGVVRTFGGVNQFHKDWEPLITNHDTAGSLCGYVTIANVRLLLQHLAGEKIVRTGAAPLTSSELESLVEAVRQPEAVMREAEREMKRIGEARRAYVGANLGDFQGDAHGSSARGYQKAWVANYEISDGFAATAGFNTMDATTDLDPSVVGSCFFARYNQYPALADATHEEAVRIGSEERRFGGKRSASGLLIFEEGDSAFMIERFSPSHVLQTPEEWSAAEGVRKDSPRVRVFAIDLNGHFSAGFACVTEVHGNTLVLINTTETVYEDNPMMECIFDLLFPPIPGLAAELCSGDDEGRVSDTDLRSLCGMGFAVEKAREALLRSGGRLTGAVELLLHDAGT